MSPVSPCGGLMKPVWASAACRRPGNFSIKMPPGNGNPFPELQATRSAKMVPPKGIRANHNQGPQDRNRAHRRVLRRPSRMAGAHQEITGEPHSGGPPIPADLLTKHIARHSPQDGGRDASKEIKQGASRPPAAKQRENPQATKKRRPGLGNLDDLEGRKMHLSGRRSHCDR